MILQMGRRKQTILKRSGLFAQGHKASPMEILTEKRAPRRKVWFSNGPKVKSRRAISIPSGWPLINIGRRTLVGSGNSQMERLRDGTPELRTAYHLLPSHLVPFDQNNCHLHRYHQFCHLERRPCHSPSHQGVFSFKGGISRSYAPPLSAHCTLLVITIFITFNATDILFTYSDILT